MSPQVSVRIGTRGSKLALAQSRLMQARIAAALDPAADPQRIAPLVEIVTTGDRVQDRRLLEIGGKALFTKEIEDALLDGRIDCAVHSLKDMPTVLPLGLTIAAVPEREDPRDAFISLNWPRLEALPQGARLGTASLRRQAQVLHQRPDIEVILLRGNVDTRLAKLEAGGADAILLAASGLNWLGLGHRVCEFVDPEAFPPAPGQGALAIETRIEDSDAPWALALRHAPSSLTIAAERAALSALDGSCRTAIGAFARIEDHQIHLSVEALSPDGRHRFRASGSCAVDLTAATSLGTAMGMSVKRSGGDHLMERP